MIFVLHLSIKTSGTYQKHLTSPFSISQEDEKTFMQILNWP